MVDQYQEHCDYEFNAQFDSVREAYAATALDPYEEGYSDYLFDCEEYDREPLTFAEWKASLKEVRVAPTFPDYGLDEIPF